MEVKQKDRVYRTGAEAPNFGTIRTEESKRKTSNSLLKYTYLVTHPTGEREEVKHLNEFCKKHGLTPPNMIAISKGRGTHHKGYKCSKIEKPSD